MLLGSVLSRPAVVDGHRVGYVIDARFVLRGPGVPGGLAAPQLIGLVIGPRRGVAFLGYERTNVTGPALLNRFFARRQRESFLVDIGDIESVGRCVVLREGFTKWSAALAP